MSRTRPVRAVVALFFASLFGLMANSAFAQQTSPSPQNSSPQRDPQAVALVQQAVAAMAPTPPSDSSATGSVTVVEGSTTQNGSIEILTLGANQTSETLNLPAMQRKVIYSKGAAKEIFGAQSSNPSMHAVFTDQCLDFPLPFLASDLANSDESFRYIGAETVDGQAVQHIQLWNSFASKPHLQELVPASLMDVWIANSTALPIKIAYSRRLSGGTSPAFPVEIHFSNYTSVNGVAYPFQIKKSLNGTPWQAITIESVSFNSGLTSAQFQVQ